MATFTRDQGAKPKLRSNGNIMQLLGLVGSSHQGSDSISFIVSVERGQIHAQLLNQRLTKLDVAAILKTHADSVSFLVEKGLLKVLGHPAATKQKFFSTTELFNAMQNRNWLSKVTDAFYEFNEIKNAQASKKNAVSTE